MRHVFFTCSESMSFLICSQGVGTAFLKSAESANLGKISFSMVVKRSRDCARSRKINYQKLALAAVEDKNYTYSYTCVIVCYGMCILYVRVLDERV